MALVDRLQSEGVPVTSNFHPGGHNWDNWSDELDVSFNRMMDAIDA